MTTLPTDPKDVEDAARQAAAVVTMARGANVAGTWTAKAGVMRTLAKVSENSNAHLFSGEAAYAAFGDLGKT